MVKMAFLLFLGLLTTGIQAQEPPHLTLSEAWQLAEQHYPLTRQTKLIEQTADMTIHNLSSGYLPQLTLGAQATYQSDVTKVSVPIQGVKIEPLSKDQYKVMADLNQVIWDGGAIRGQKTIEELSAGVQKQQVEVELFQLRDRINQIFLGVLYLDAQLGQVDLVRADLQTGINRVTAQIAQGVSFRSNLSVLKAEMLKADQRSIELRASRTGLLETLSLFLGRPVPPDTQLDQPDMPSTSPAAPLARPELALFRKQSDLINARKDLIRARNTPKASLFVQSGYGRPGLNMLQNNFDFYYLGGIRLSWSLGSLYTKKREKQLVDVNRQIVDLQQETFVMNTNATLRKQEAEISKLEQLVATDDGIVALREEVKDAAKSQLENGVITANDYLREVNAEDQARQGRITHQLQLLQAKINYQTISGNVNY